ncbi:hypothetical protein [Salinibacterium sp.]|nr:hypothetical protein [Salinibacterium sp.]
MHGRVSTFNGTPMAFLAAGVIPVVVAALTLLIAPPRSNELAH